MAYAASIDDTKPTHIDTTVSGGIVGHPLFVVCLEWPVLASCRLDDPDVQVTGASAVLHAGQDTIIHRLVRPGDSLATSLTIEGIEAKRPGVLVRYLLETVDAEGLPVATTRFDVLALGAHHDLPDFAPTGDNLPAWVPPSEASGLHEATFQVGAGSAHIYSECARIFNPIHTDRAVARAAGMDHPILHGTATLARAVSTIVDQVWEGRSETVTRVSGRFASPVTPPSVLTVRWSTCDDAVVTFQVVAPGDRVVVDQGLIMNSD